MLWLSWGYDKKTVTMFLVVTFSLSGYCCSDCDKTNASQPNDCLFSPFVDIFQVYGNEVDFVQEMFLDQMDS